MSDETLKIEMRERVKEGLQLAHDLNRMTLHGSPPMRTIMLIASAAVALGEEVDRLTDEVDGFVKSAHEDRIKLLDALHRLDEIYCLSNMGAK